jgi:hypothetical protein
VQRWRAVFEEEGQKNRGKKRDEKIELLSRDWVSQGKKKNRRSNFAKPQHISACQSDRPMKTS